MKQCIPPASQGNLFVKGFDLRQQPTGRRRLRQMGTKSVSVCLYTEQASCGSPSRHSGSSSALQFKLWLLHWYDHYSWPAYGWKPTLNRTSFLGSFFYHMFVDHGVCDVQTCDNLLLLPCGKFVVSLHLTRLEFLLKCTYIHTHTHKHTHTWLSHMCSNSSKCGSNLQQARHIHFARTDMNQLFHTLYYSYTKKKKKERNPRTKVTEAEELS